MFNEKAVHEAIKRSWAWDYSTGTPPHNPASGEDKEISLLIHDVFGGEILKTPKKKGWHFYNRINGKRIDFFNLDFAKLFNCNRFKDIVATPDEIYQDFDQTDYSAFYMKFVKAFEEFMGLKKQRTRYSTR